MKNHRHRFFVVEELLQTERGYSQDLTILCSYAINILEQEHILKPEHFEVLIGNIHEIQQFHEKLVTEIDSVSKDSSNYLI